MSGQRGAALLLVLIMMVLISVVGTLAVNSSILGLKLASNSQIQALLLQRSDAVLFALEDRQLIAQQFNAQGVLGYFNREGRAQDQLVFCYRTQSTTFMDLQQAAVIRANGSIDPQATQGFCRANDYATSRATVISQLYLRKNSQPLAIFSFVPLGNSLGQSPLPLQSEQISVTVISIFPSWSGRSGREIESCFQQLESQVMACFRRLNVPFNLQHAEYRIGHRLQTTAEV